jgi:hypothetical protein
LKPATYYASLLITNVCELADDGHFSRPHLLKKQHRSEKGVPMNIRLALRACSVAQVIAAAAISTPAVAAQDSQLWVNSTTTVKLSAKWRVSEDLTFRFSDKRNGLYEIESNTLLGYVVGKGITLWGGYTHDPQYAAGHFTIMEQRAREQVTFDNFAQLGKGKFNGRIRLEQRWRDGVSGTGWRLRPFLKYTLPFHKGKKTALVLSVEPFLDLNNTPFQKTDGLDRIRTFVGISIPVSKNAALEAGYLNQHTFVPDKPDNNDHVASFSLVANF